MVPSGWVAIPSSGTIFQVQQGDEYSLLWKIKAGVPRVVYWDKFCTCGILSPEGVAVATFAHISIMSLRENVEDAIAKLHQALNHVNTWTLNAGPLNETKPVHKIYSVCIY